MSNALLCNSNKPSISVVIPAYNVETYILEAVNSVLEQTVLPNEIIIIDDGSTDGTNKILVQFSENPLIRIVRTQNNGLGIARNLGRSLCKSKYIYFFDSDDLLKSQFIESIHGIIQEYSHPDLILFSGETFRDDTFEHTYSPTYRRTLVGQFDDRDKLLSQLVHRGEMIASACLYVTKSTLWSNNRVSFPSILHEDEAVIYQLIALSANTVVLDEAYFMRRVREGSIMTSGLDVRNVHGVLRILHETIEFMNLESVLVSQEIKAWRSRIKSLTLQYIFLCRATKQRIMWSLVLSKVIMIPEMIFIIKIIYYISPYYIQNYLRNSKNKVKNKQKKYP